jgi:hypothetical protein
MPSRVLFDPTSACAACRGRHVRHTCTRVRNRRRRGYAPVRGCGGCAGRHVRHTCTAEERDAADAAQAAAVQAAADAAAEREAARVAAAAAEREAFNAERNRECAICLELMLDDNCLVRHGACRHWWHYVCIAEYITDHVDPAPPCLHCGDILGL